MLAQNPAGFLPRVYYGLTSGYQTYRFTLDAEIEESLTGADGTAFQLYSNNETDNSYIPAIAVKIDSTKIKIIIQGDYRNNSQSFNAVNMTTGASTTITFTGDDYPLSLQDASSLLNYPAVDNKEKQITVLNNLEDNSKNVVFASIDINSDGVYNWIEIGNFVDGVDGKSVLSMNSTNRSHIFSIMRPEDTILIAEDFIWEFYPIGTSSITYIDKEFLAGELYNVVSVSPNKAISKLGSIKGATGQTGATGQNGIDGTKVISDSGAPSDSLGVDGDTYIDIGTWNVYTKDSGSWTSVGNIKGANGTNGTNGQNGQAFQMQSGLYSTLDNWGETGNVDGEGNALLQLPTLPQSNISGKGYVVYDPLTTPLAPFYDLYYANNGDTEWTIIHPFSGIAGQDGTDGQTPYISGGTWWIGNTNTGVAATGPQGPTGPTPTGSALLTLTDTNWVNNSQTIQYNHDTTKRNIIDVDPSSIEEWSAAGVYALSETSTSITFVCTNVPAEDLDFRVISEVVNYAS